VCVRRFTGSSVGRGGAPSRRLPPPPEPPQTQRRACHWQPIGARTHTHTHTHTYTHTHTHTRARAHRDIYIHSLTHTHTLYITPRSCKWKFAACVRSSCTATTASRPGPARSAPSCLPRLSRCHAAHCLFILCVFFVCMCVVCGVCLFICSLIVATQGLLNDHFERFRKIALQVLFSLSLSLLTQNKQIRRCAVRMRG